MTVEVIKTFTTTCYGPLHDNIANDVAFTAILEQVVATSPTTTSFFFDIALSTVEDTALDNILATWVCPSALSITASSMSFTDSVGMLLPIAFNYELLVRNKWLSHEGDNGLSSDKTPAIMPFTCKLIGLTFNNDRKTADTDIEIYQTPKNSTVRTKIATWQIRASSSGHKTDIPEIIFNAGDKIGVYLRDKGNDPKKVIVMLYVQLLELVPEENTESL